MEYLIEKTIAASGYPVTTAEAKAHAVVDFDADDALIDGMIAAATRAVSEMSGRSIGAETWLMSFGAGVSGRVYLPVTPVQSVSEISYYDTDDVLQSATVSDFYLIKDGDVAFLRPKSGASWPSANGNREDAISITFIAGYSECPDTLRHAILMMVAHMYSHREAVSDEILRDVPSGVQDLINLERVGWVGS